MQLSTALNHEILADFQQCDIALSKFNKSIIAFILHHTHSTLSKEESVNTHQITKTLVKSLSNKIRGIESILDLVHLDDNEEDEYILTFSEFKGKLNNLSKGTHYIKPIEVKKQIDEVRKESIQRMKESTLGKRDENTQVGTTATTESPKNMDTKTSSDKEESPNFNSNEFNPKCRSRNLPNKINFNHFQHLTLTPIFLLKRKC